MRTPQILFLTDGRLVGSTREFNQHPENKARITQIRDSLLVEVRLRIDRLREKGCAIHGITIGGDPSDIVVWKELSLATGGIYYATQSRNLAPAQLEDLQDKILAKILGMYQIDLVLPESEHGESKPLTILARFLRDTLLVREPRILLKAEISHTSKTEILELEPNQHGDYFTTYLDKPEAGEYLIRLEAIDDNNILQRAEEKVTVGKSSLVEYLLVLSLVVAGICIAGIYIWLYIREKNNRKFEIRKTDQQVKIVEKLIKRGDFNRAVTTSIELVKTLSAFAEKQESETIDFIAPAYEKMYCNVYRDIKSRLKTNSEARFDLKKRVFAQFFNAAFDKTKNSANQRAFAKMIAYTLNQDNLDDLFDDIDVMLSILNKDKEDVSIIFTHIIKSLQNYDINNQTIQQASRVIKAYIDLNNVNEYNVKVVLETAVRAFDEARHSFRGGERVYRYYLRILEAFEPALSAEKNHWEFLNAVKDFSESNEKNWELSKI